MNVQFACKKNKDSGEFDIYILEVNPRASRTVPFVAKATGVPIAKIAARIMAGEKLKSFRVQGMLKGMAPDHLAVKAPVFPFSRFAGVDPILGPEMKSTGEVMGLDMEVGQAFAKAQMGAGMTPPLDGKVFLSVKDEDKDELLLIARELEEMKFDLVATSGTCQFLKMNGVRVERVNKVMEGRPNIIDHMINGDIHLMINTTKGTQAHADSQSIRRTALMNKVPYYTLLTAARAGVQAIRAMNNKQIDVKPLQDYLDDAA